MAGGDAGRSGREPGPAPEGAVAEDWRVEVPGTITGSPALAADLLAVTTDEGWLLALDPATGQERWRAPIEPGGAATPAIDADVVHVVDGGLADFDVATGELLWRMDGIATTDPLLTGHTLLASGPNGLVAIDVGGARGLEAWRFLPDAASEMGELSRPARVDGAVVVVSPAIRGGPGTVWALDLATGGQVWQRDDLEAVTSPTATGGVVVVGTRHDTIAWLDAGSGETLLEVDIGGRAASAASTDGDTWYVGTDDGELVAVDHDGAVRWVFATDDSIAAQPSIAGDTIVAASYDGFVYALDRTSGEERWRFETGREMKGAPSVADGVVIVAAGSEIIAIEGGH
jgi:outer membrane protein assembly factor BamB